MKYLLCIEKDVYKNTPMFLLRDSRDEEWVDRDTVKRNIKSQKWDVLNLQIATNGNLVERHPADSCLGALETVQINSHLSELCSKYSKLPNVQARSKEMRMEKDNPDFITLGSASFKVGNKDLIYYVYYAPFGPKGAYYSCFYERFENGDSVDYDELSYSTRIDETISNIKQHLKETLGVSLQGTKIESGISVFLRDFKEKPDGTAIQANNAVVRSGDYKITTEFVKRLQDVNLCQILDSNDMKSAYLLKLNLANGGFQSLLKLCYTYGTRLKVQVKNDKEEQYLREINNYYNKKGCAITSKGILKVA